LLVDPERLKKEGHHYSIDYFSPSLNGKWVAYGISPGGSEESVIHILEVDSGRELLLRVDFDAGHGMGSTKPQNEELNADMQSFFLWQFGDPEFQPNAPERVTSRGSR
jgi:protease II